MTKKREILIAKKRVGDLKFEMPNPRKIKKKKREELQKSLENLGDWGEKIYDFDFNKNVTKIKVKR